MLSHWTALILHVDIYVMRFRKFCHILIMRRAESFKLHNVRLCCVLLEVLLSSFYHSFWLWYSTVDCTVHDFSKKKTAKESSWKSSVDVLLQCNLMRMFYSRFYSIFSCLYWTVTHSHASFFSVRAYDKILYSSYYMNLLCCFPINSFYARIFYLTFDLSLYYHTNHYNLIHLPITALFWEQDYSPHCPPQHQ